MNIHEQNLRKSIGKKIKLARAKSKFTQEQLAEKLSLSPRYISQIERGIAFGSASTIISICKVLNINSDFLFDDLIKNENPILNKVADDKFLENYLKLNDYNKNLINLFINDLVKYQDSSNAKKIFNNIKKS